MVLDYKLIGIRIKEFRNLKGLTQNQLAEMLDISNVYVSRLERGTAKISLEMTYKIANILDAPIGKILTGVDPESQDYLDFEINELLKNCPNDKKKLIYDLIKTVMAH